MQRTLSESRRRPLGVTILVVLLIYFLVDTNVRTAFFGR
jgi:hypothetical protein